MFAQENSQANDPEDEHVPDAAKLEAQDDSSTKIALNTYNDWILPNNSTCRESGIAIEEPICPVFGSRHGPVINDDDDT